MLSQKTAFLFQKHFFAFLYLPLFLKFFSSEDLTCETIDEDPIVLFVGKNHPWAKRKAIKISALKNTNFLISNPKTSIINYIESLGSFKFNPEKIYTIGNIEAIKQAVISRIGVSILSYHSIRNELNYGLIKTVPFKENIKMTRKIYLIKNKEHKYSLAEEVFVSFLKNSLNQ
ncbi:DNA-binding transcriptional LysR family regulator [Clostridium tetanomorphum]|uniref:LysR substrate-binding domain-containing protein n=1 Tax=Clostridium tetanomorphum TaxID=1553 RepID=A0A923J2U2_CLOTT|nr:LysR substrate-binding domain-containing protein [Clostridium tetanomorphum]KAJ51711.1 transcriptional regulator [Clostridium tetanomorphum DSM 665]MBC2399113.1 hypothetical protein [Clostridium tetanomorphum]NRS86104.1 DNA-binding transcriptional LysR family regulator [Clostridium tetanomorphum]